jgi:NHS family xanthosine MFS transporter
MIQKYFTKAYTNIQSLSDYVGAPAKDEHLTTFLKNKGIEVLANGDLSRALDVKDWRSIWLSFTLYAFGIMVLFMLLFKHKHTKAEEKAIEAISH